MFRVFMWLERLITSRRGTVWWGDQLGGLVKASACNERAVFAQKRNGENIFRYIVDVFASLKLPYKHENLKEG